MEGTDYLARVVSFSALAISAIALFFTFRKDAHRISITKTEAKYDAVILRVSNDSSFSVGIWGVGSFTENGVIKWIENVGDYKTNKFASYPIRVEAHSAFSIVVIAGREIPSSVPHGYCVQLESGRTFVLPSTVPIPATIKMHLRSLLSRISAGSLGFPKFHPIRD
jgi:hypothetical protein